MTLKTPLNYKYSNLSIKSIYHSYPLINVSNNFQKRSFQKNFHPFSNGNSFSRVVPPRFQIFNRQAHHKNRIFASKLENSMPFEYIREEISLNIVSRLEYIMKDFTSVAEIGCGKGWIYRILSAPDELTNQGASEESTDRLLRENQQFNPNEYPIQKKIESNEQIDESQNNALFKKWNMSQYVLIDQCEDNLIYIPDVPDIELVRVLANEERLPLNSNSFDLIMSGHYLHNINDLEGVFKQINDALKPDGCFVGAMFGGNTLHELKSCFVWAEHEREGGVSPHVSPMVGIRDVGDLMTGSGFNLPTIDSDEIVVYYPDAFTLMKHLQLMGEGNVISNRRPNISKETLLAAAALYDELFYDKEKGGIPATFELIYMIGWKQHDNQPKPKLRGSAEFSLKQFAEEINTEVYSIKDNETDMIIEDDDTNESDDETQHR